MKRLCLVLITLLATSSAFGFGRMEKLEVRLQARFEAADTNHDGKLTYAEAAAGMPRVARHFSEIDKGHKGYVTLSDIKRYIVKEFIEASRR